MNRRKFLKITGVGTAALTIAPTLFIQEVPIPEPDFIWEMVGARPRSSWPAEILENHISSYIPGNEKMYLKMDEIFNKHKKIL